MKVLNVSSRLHSRIVNHPARGDRNIGEFTAEILEAYLNSPQALIEELQGKNAGLKEQRAELEEKLGDAKTRIEILERCVAEQANGTRESPVDIADLARKDLSDGQDASDVT